MRIAIVGAGPAGLSCAVALHDRHFEVSIFEQFSQPQPVGSGLVLQPTGLAALGAINLRTNVEQYGQKIDRMLGKLAPNGKTVLDIKYRVIGQDLYGLAIHRASLFQVLFDAVNDRNIPIHTDCKITSIKQCSNTASLISNNMPIDNPFDLVIDASGVNSSLLKSLQPHLKSKPLNYGALWTTVNLCDFHTDTLEQRYVKASRMLGVLPCGTMPGSTDNLATLFYSIETKDYDQWLANGLEHWKDAMHRLWPETTPLTEQITDMDQLTFAQYRHHTLSKPYTGNVVFIGDTAHATSPQLGQGANMALIDSLALAVALMNNKGNTGTALREYAKLRTKHIQLYQMFSYLLTPFYQSNSTTLPLIRDIIFNPVMAIGIINRFITRLGAGMLLSPTDSLAERYNQFLD